MFRNACLVGIEELTTRCNDIAAHIERHKVRSQVLHQVMHRSFASIVNKTVGEASQTAHTTDRHNLAAGLAASFSTLVAFDQ